MDIVLFLFYLCVLLPATPPRFRPHLCSITGCVYKPCPSLSLVLSLCFESCLNTVFGLCYNKP